MPKVTNTPSQTKPIIDLWDTDRIGNDAEFYYVTPEMDETQEARKFRATADDLRTFIEENELNQLQTDVDEFKSYDAHDYLMDNWEEVVGKYWEQVVSIKLEQSYKDAMAFVQSYIAKAGHPLTQTELNNLNRRVYILYHVHFGKEAA